LFVMCLLLLLRLVPLLNPFLLDPSRPPLSGTPRGSACGDA
jgi:hypothetical protein